MIFFRFSALLEDWLENYAKILQFLQKIWQNQLNLIFFINFDKKFISITKEGQIWTLFLQNLWKCWQILKLFNVCKILQIFTKFGNFFSNLKFLQTAIFFAVLMKFFIIFFKKLNVFACFFQNFANFWQVLRNFAINFLRVYNYWFFKSFLN